MLVNEELHRNPHTSNLQEERTLVRGTPGLATIRKKRDLRRKTDRKTETGTLTRGIIREKKF